MKLSNIRTKTFTNATAGGLDTDVKTWIDANAAEKEFIDAQFGFDGATFTLVLIYAE